MNLVEFLYSLALLSAIGGSQGATSTSSFSIKQGDFSCGSGGNLRCSGNATTEEGLLKLTPDPPGRTENYTHFSNTVGVALYSERVQLQSRATDQVAALNISFSFRIEAGYQGSTGDGMAFVMFADTWIGVSGASLGAFDKDGQAMGNTLAVEFDTFKNTIDSDDNHVGIDIYSVTSDKAERVPFNLGADRVYVWIYYTPLSSTLEVRLNSVREKPEKAFISYTRNLLDVFEDENVWVGFSGSNSFCNCFSYYTVFDMEYESSFGPLVPSSAPSLLLPSSAPSPAPETRQKSSVSTSLIAGVTIGVAGTLVGGCLLVVCGCRKLRMRSRLLSGSGRTPGNGAMAAQEFQFAGLSRSLKTYDYKQLCTATNNFDEALKLGAGGFGSVYRGVIPGISPKLLVAVKKVSSESRQGEREFVAEVSTIGLLRHRNIVQLLDWCSEGQGKYLLVYELMPNGSLDKHLFPSPVSQQAEGQSVLSWDLRFKILGGLAAALHYLHEGWRQQVIHRDVKSSNIMLDDNFNAMLGDFGLARMADHYKNPETTLVAGTFGYMAPEASRTGKFTAKTDVFAFGAVCLEIACGRKVCNVHLMADEMLLVDYVQRKLSQDELMSVVDRRLEGHYDVQEVEVVLLLGLLCSQPEPEERPPMHRVVEILAGSVEMPPIPRTKPEIEYSSYQSRKKRLVSSGSGVSANEAECMTYSIHQV